MASVNKVNRGKRLRTIPIESYKKLLREQLENKVTKNESGCWLWIGTMQKNGYGSKKLFGKTTTAHRAAYFAYNGEIPTGMEVMHNCDVRGCINPAHLSIGNHAQNMRDAKIRCRSRNGVMTCSYVPNRDISGRFIKLNGDKNGKLKSV